MNNLPKTHTRGARRAHLRVKSTVYKAVPLAEIADTYRQARQQLKFVVSLKYKKFMIWPLHSVLILIFLE